MPRGVWGAGLAFGLRFMRLVRSCMAFFVSAMQLVALRTFLIVIRRHGLPSVRRSSRKSASFSGASEMPTPSTR